MKRFGLLLLGVLATAQCGGGGGGTGPSPSTIAVNAGNNQVGAAGTALPESLAVIVKDQSGAVMSGITVNFTITAGGGTVSPASRITDAAGIAKTRRTLGPNAGTQTVNASAGNLNPVPFSAVSQINGAVNIANTTTGPLTDTVGSTKAESLTVLVTDQSATPVQGVTVAWASTGGSVSSASVPTSAAGLSKVRFTYGNSAVVAQTATATVTGLVGSPVTITLTGTAGTAVAIAKTTGDNGTAAPSGQVAYTVQSRDSHGNPKGGVTIDWAVLTGGGSITPAQNVTAANGNATAQRTLGGGLGAQTATATAAALTGAPADTFTTTAAIITTVQVRDFSFSPNDITVPQNTIVTFNWGAGPTSFHTVTFEAAGAPSDISQRTSGSVGRQFTNTGTFTYHCALHTFMTGSVTVTP